MINEKVLKPELLKRIFLADTEKAVENISISNLDNQIYLFLTSKEVPETILSLCEDLHFEEGIELMLLPIYDYNPNIYECIWVRRG